MSLLLEIVTPDSNVYSETIEHVILPTQSGEIDVLDGHIPLMAMIEPGELQVTKDGKTDAIAIDRGFVQIHGDKVSVITEAAINVKDIDLSELNDARLRAEEALKEAKDKGLDAELLEELETKARFTIVQELAKEKYGK